MLNLNSRSSVGISIVPSSHGKRAGPGSVTMDSDLSLFSSTLSQAPWSLIKQSTAQDELWLQQPLPGDAGEIGHDILELLVRDLTEGWVVREGDDGASILSPPTWEEKGRYSAESRSCSRLQQILLVNTGCLN